jgi:hypothetical protein
MNKLSLAAIALVFGLTTSAQAHEPAGEVFGLWQWPTSHLPLLDADLREYDIVPDELWLTHNNMIARRDDAETPKGGHNQQPDASDLAYRFLPSWNDETDRIYYAIERFDDKWSLDDDIEIGVDADHSAGTFWSFEGMTDEEIARNRSRHAQISHFWFDGGTRLGEGKWNWMWMTQGTWHDVPPYSDVAERFEGTPTSQQEMTQWAEWWNVYWDDYNWEDPAGSVIHDLQEGETIHMRAVIKDQDGVWDTDEEERRANGYQFQSWTIQNTCLQDHKNSDCMADFLLLPADVDLLATAVEGDSWGDIKASLSR